MTSKWFEAATMTTAAVTKRKQARDAEKKKGNVAQTAVAPLSTFLQNEGAPVQEPRQRVERPREGISSLVPLARNQQSSFAPIQRKQIQVSEIMDGLSFSLKEDAARDPFMNGNIKMVPLRSARQGGPVLVEFRGGGRIPFTFGYKEYPNAKGRKNGVVSFEVESPEDQHAFRTMRQELVELSVTGMETWLPTVSPATVESVVQGIMGEPQDKKDNSGKYLPNGSATINEEDLDAVDCNSEPKLKIFDHEGNRIFDLHVLPGTRWTYIALHLKQIWIGWKAQKDAHGVLTGVQLPQIKISAQVCFMHIAPDESQMHTVYPHQKEQHDLEDCKRRHTEIIPVKDFMWDRDVKVHPMTTKEQANTAFIENQRGGGVFISLTDGGSLPPFVVTKNRDDKVVLTWSVGQSEVDALAKISDSYTAYCCQPAKAKEFFPRKNLTLEMKQTMVKRLIKLPEDKLDGEEEEEAKEDPEPDAKRVKQEQQPSTTTALVPAQQESRSFDNLMNSIIDLGTDENPLLGKTVFILDHDNSLITDPLTQLPRRRWATIWIQLKSLYHQKVDQLFSNGIAKRVVFMQLAPPQDVFFIKQPDFHFQTAKALTMEPEERFPIKAVSYHHDNHDDDADAND
jgi:hypothetical protein